MSDPASSSQRCPHCGERHPHDAVSCASCQRPLSPAKPESEAPTEFGTAPGKPSGDDGETPTEYRTTPGPAGEDDGEMPTEHSPSAVTGRAGVLTSSLVEITCEEAEAQWLANRSRWRHPLPALPLGGRDLARNVALICSLAVAGMALAFFGSYLAAHEAMDAYDKATAVGAVGLGIAFGATGIWLHTISERMKRKVVRKTRKRAAPDHPVSE